MNIGFIGTGKISSAVIESLCTSGMEGYRIFVSPRNKERSSELAEKFERVTRLNSNQDVLDKADVVILALRPPVYKGIVSGLKFREDHKVISLIPFSYYEDLIELIKPAQKLSRATPLPTVVTHTCPIPVFNPDETVLNILKHLGQPFEVQSEEELHTIWTLTCLISPYYDLLSSLSDWASENSVSKDVANKYVADMFNTLSFASHMQEKPDFNALSHHAATPGGLNEKTAKEIKAAGAHKAYVDAAEYIRGLFEQ